MNAYAITIELSIPDGDAERAYEIEDALEGLLEDCALDCSAGRWLLTAYVQADTAVAAGNAVLRAVGQTAAEPLWLDSGLDSASDIAARLGISRQAVQAWTADPTFPRIAAVISHARVWRWGDVNDWLRWKGSEHGEASIWPNRHEEISINGLIQAARGRRSAADARADFARRTAVAPGTPSLLWATMAHAPAAPELARLPHEFDLAA